MECVGFKNEAVMSTATSLKIEEPFTIKILNRKFPVKCGKNQQDQLEKAASYLSHAVQSIRDSGKLVDFERTLVMAALNITHDYLNLKEKSSDHSKTIVNRLQILREKLDTVLVDTEES